MHIRAAGTPVRRARIKLRRSVTAAVTALALAATIAPAVAAPNEPERPKSAASAWGKDGKAQPPKVKIGTNEAPKSVPSAGIREHFHPDGTLWRVVDRNWNDIAADHHASGGSKLTDEQSGRWVDLVKKPANRWEATDNAGRTVVYTLDAAGNLIGTTDSVAGKSTVFAYDADAGHEGDHAGRAPDCLHL